MRLILALLFTTFYLNSFGSTYGDLKNSPPNFNHFGDKYIFVDFEFASYDIEFDVKNKKAMATSYIEFVNDQEGYPIFDLKEDIIEFTIDGEHVSVSDIPFPKKESWAKAGLKKLAPGKHTMTIRHEIKENIEFSGDIAKAGFWTSDLSDRNFLEAYLPANLEFDQVKMEFNITFKGTNKKHRIFTNFETFTETNGTYSFTYPDHFTSSSLYFHVSGASEFNVKEGVYKSIDGREIKLVVYGKKFISTSKFYNGSIKFLKELEADYGPFPHNQLIVYGTSNGGGMEYCGATITSYWALGHEIIHSYFARGVKPQSGNSGWIDEAIASWRDDGYPVNKTLKVFSANMASRSVYRRKTDYAAYSDGASFMAHLDHIIKDSGGMKKFLKYLADNYMFKSIDNQDLISALDNFTGDSLKPLFEKYIFKKRLLVEKQSKKKNNPYHPPVTKEYLRSLL